MLGDQFSLHDLIGPASGLIISLIFAYTFYKLFLMMMQKHETITSTLIAAFQEDIKGCNERYNYILTELLKVKQQVSEH